MINWQDKAYRTLQEHVLRNTQDIRELFKKLRHTRWTPENVAKLYDSLTALKYDDPEIALDLIDELITALGGNPPARPKHALIGIKAETSHGAVDQFDLIDKDWFEVTAYFEDGTSEPVTDFLLLTEVALTAPYTNVEVEYLGFRDVVPLQANARRVITLNTANTTTVVNDQTGRVLHNGDSVFDGDVLTMASSQPNSGYLITGRNVEQLGIVNPIEVGGTIVVHADVLVNVFAKAEVYHTVTINKASGVTFTLVDEAGNNVASGASFLEGTKLTVTAIGDAYPHAAVVGGELIQLYEGTVIVVSDDVVITVGEEAPVTYVCLGSVGGIYDGYGGNMITGPIPAGTTVYAYVPGLSTGDAATVEFYDADGNVLAEQVATRGNDWLAWIVNQDFGVRFKDEKRYKIYLSEPSYPSAEKIHEFSYTVAICDTAASDDPENPVIVATASYPSATGGDGLLNFAITEDPDYGYDHYAPMFTSGTFKPSVGYGFFGPDSAHVIFTQWSFLQSCVDLEKKGNTPSAPYTLQPPYDIQLTLPIEGPGQTTWNPQIIWTGDHD